MEVTIERYMAKSPVTIESAIGVEEALEYMRDNGIRHLPVTEESRLVGILSERDLREGVALPAGPTLKVSDIMKTKVYAVRETASLKDVTAEMASERYGSVVVVNRLRQVTGIFTTTDALNLLSDLLEGRWDEQEIPEDFQDLWGSTEDNERFSS